jgi:hypothetical protein
MIQAVKFNTWRRSCAWPVVISAALTAGCAGGAWLESPIEAELPIDPPKHGYPTALPSGSVNVPATPASSMSPPAAATQAQINPESVNVHAAQAQMASQQPPASHRDRPQSLRPNLAVIPPQYVHSLPTAAPETASQLAPAAHNQPSTPSVGPQTSTAPLPQLDLSFLDALANSQGPQTTAGSSSAATANVAAEVTNAKSSVQPTSTESSESPTQRQERLEKALATLIEALETEIRQRREVNASDEQLPRLEQQLRLVYAAAGRLDDAVSVVKSLDASQSEAYKNLMFGLGVWLSPDEARRAPLRTAKVLHSLRDATSDLTAASKLELKNLAFCERVDQFGWYTEFPRKEFQPKQQVILYAEVENFAAEQKGPSSFETELHGSYVILDSSGQEISSRQLQPDKEICRNHRRDYFLAYRLYMPDNIPPGRYRLELTVEDLKARGKYQGRKLGDGVIEFTIR